METALDVLSRAATMVQDNANEARLTAKELPTAKWRRDRRMRTNEYHSQSGVLSTTVNPSSSSPTSTALAAPSPFSSESPERLDYVLHPVPHDIAVAVGATPPTSASPSSPMTIMAAAANAAIRPLCESNNRLTSSVGAALAAGISSSSGATAFTPQHAHQHTSLQAHHHHHHHHHQQAQHLLAAAAHHHHQQQQQQQQQQGIDSPLDMTVPHSLKQRSSPPPPYREPLPGSMYASALARPSVITQAPSKRLERGGGGGESGLDLATTDIASNQTLISNRENENREAESASMCENVIDEHFRRSLGADYAALFGKRSPAHSPQPAHLALQNADTPTPPPPPPISSSSCLQTAAPTMAVDLVKQLPLHAVSSLVGMQPPPPAYHQTATTTPLPVHPLISPKPAAVLLCPAAIAAAGYIKDEPQQQQQTRMHSPIQQPLSLHRSASNSPSTPTSPQALTSTTSTNISSNNNSHSSNSNGLNMSTINKNTSHMQRLAAKRRALPQPATASAVAASLIKTTTNTAEPHSPTPSPSHTPPVVAIVTSTTSPPAVLPAIMRIKTEPGLSATATAAAAATTTPPASPNSASNASITNSDVLASVDDHFAKALGDTWKKLQERK